MLSCRWDAIQRRTRQRICCRGFRDIVCVESGGPSACGRHGALGSIHNGYKDRLFFLCLDESDIIEGYAHLIPDAVEELLSCLKKRPRAVMMIFTCLDDLIGTDHDALRGELQMVLIARALIKEPKILIMDEPESNLDMKNQLIVLNTIDRLNEEKLSIVINTHYPDHALRCAGKTLIIGRRKHLFGDTGQVITEDRLREFFEIESDIVQSVRAGRTLQGIIPLDITRPQA